MKEIQMPEFGALNAGDWDCLLSYDPSDYLSQIEESLRHGNRFFVDNRFNKLLYFYATDCKAVSESLYNVSKGSVMFRARIYHNSDAESRAKNAVEGQFNGYDFDGSYVSTKNWGNQGRINPDGITYLYLASTQDCAATEISPVIGDWVSVAKIEFLECARVFNLGKMVVSGIFEDQARSDWAMTVMAKLDDTFSRPYRSNGDYLLCQYVSEFLKNIGFDGIRFLSSKVLQTFGSEDYVNYVIFNYEKCKPISSDLLYIFDTKIRSLTYLQKESMTYHGEVE